MGRAKQYERTDLLDRAVELFRRQGFNGTSTAELATELGVNRKSMYAEFGSKQALFEATLEHYDRFHLSRVLAQRVSTRLLLSDCGSLEPLKRCHPLLVGQNLFSNL